MYSKRRSVTIFFAHSKDVERDTFWQPAADVYSTCSGWLLKFELAGVRPEDVTVTVIGSRVRVQGVRRDWTAQEVISYHSMEIAYNRFERTVELPCSVEGCQFSFEFRDGLLLVRVLHEGERL
jgi:HSP20 family protein